MPLPLVDRADRWREAYRLNRAGLTGRQAASRMSVSLRQYRYYLHDATVRLRDEGRVNDAIETLEQKQAKRADEMLTEIHLAKGHDVIVARDRTLAQAIGRLRDRLTKERETS